MNNHILILKNNINEERRKRKIKISDICRYLGKDRFYIAKLQNPSLRSIVDIAQAIGCQPSDLLKGL